MIKKFDKKISIAVAAVIAATMIVLSIFFITTSNTNVESDSIIVGKNTDLVLSNSEAVDDENAVAAKKYLSELIEASHAAMLEFGYTETVWNVKTKQTTISVYQPEGEKTYVIIPELNFNHLVETEDLLMPTTLKNNLGYMGKKWEVTESEISVLLDGEYFTQTFTITDGLITKVVQSHDGELVMETVMQYSVTPEAQKYIDTATVFEPQMREGKPYLTYSEALESPYWSGPLPPKGVTVLPLAPDGSAPAPTPLPTDFDTFNE